MDQNNVLLNLKFGENQRRFVYNLGKHVTEKSAILFLLIGQT
jgi:hypothetical protein